MWIIFSIVQIPQKIALFLIRVYQKTLSPDHGIAKHQFPDGYCKFYPTCSQYGYESIARHGLLKGGVYTVWRILRCNPWNPGGVDKVKQ